jgi:hypothetical protein
LGDNFQDFNTKVLKSGSFGNHDFRMISKGVGDGRKMLGSHFIPTSIDFFKKSMNHEIMIFNTKVLKITCF